MSEVKILKDLTPANNWDTVKFSVRHGIIKLYSDIILRKNAIEHIKEIEIRFPNVTKKKFNLPDDIDTVCARAVRKWLIYYNDITEKDLK